MANEIVPKKQSAMEIVVAKMDAVRQVATKYLTADRAVKLLGVQMMKTPKLAECVPSTILEGVMLSAQLGLEIGGPLGLFYLVPRQISVKEGTDWKKKMVAVPQIGYRGMIQILWRSGVVKHVDAVAVYKGDRFEVTQGSSPRIIHVPNINADELTDRDITHVYATIEYTNGGKQFRWMSRKQVERVRDRFSASYDKDKPDKGVWGEHFGAMALKTVVFRLAKFSPVTQQNQSAVEVATSIENDDPALSAGSDAELPTTPQDSKPETLALPDPEAAGTPQEPPTVTAEEAEQKERDDALFIQSLSTPPSSGGQSKGGK